MPLPRTSSEVIEEAPKWLARLSRNLTNVEHGEEGAGDELAGTLRTLLDSTNKGNRLVVRLSVALKSSFPEVFVSGGPEADSDGLVLSFGNLPLVPAPDDGYPHSPRYLPFEAWMRAPSLVVPGSEKRKQSWEQFVTLIANTDGAHFGIENHNLLTTSKLFGAVGLSLRDYLLHQVGWQVERVFADLLARAGRPLIPRDRPLEQWLRMPVWMTFRDQPGKGMGVSVAVNVTSDDYRSIEVMRFGWRDRTHHMYHDGGNPIHGGPRVRFVIDDPITGLQSTTDAIQQQTGWKPDDWDG